MSRTVRTLPLAILGLVGLISLTPLIISPGVFSHFVVSKALYTRSLIEIMGALWLILLARDAEYRPPRSWVLLALTMFLLVAVAAAVAGTNPTRSFWSTYARMTGVWDLAHWFLFVLVLVSVARTFRAWRGILNAQLAVSLLLSLISLGQVWGLLNGTWFQSDCRVSATLGNPSYLAPVLVMAILLSVGFLTQSFLTRRERNPQLTEANPPIRPPTSPAVKQRVWRSFWFLVAATGLLALVYTGTRGALIGVSLGALSVPLAVDIWGNRQALVPVAVGFGGVLAGVVLLYGIDSTVGLPTQDGCGSRSAADRFNSLLVDNSDTGDAGLENRLAAINAGLRAFPEHPFLGWGPENFGTAFDKHADPAIFKQGSFTQDRAHNIVIEQLVTEGVLGLAAFAALWIAIVWAVTRQRRRAREEVFTYAVLGALAGYLGQALFFFDTSASLLLWSILVAWVISKEGRESGKLSSASGEPNRRTRLSRGFNSVALQGLAGLARPWSRWAITIGALAAAGLSIFFYGYTPYHAAREFNQSLRGGQTVYQRLSLADQSMIDFPQLANLPRRLTILELADRWNLMGTEDRRWASQFVAYHASRGLTQDPTDGPLLIATLMFAQKTGHTPEAREALVPLLDQLRELAPQRVETHWLLANQALQEGEYSKAISIMDAYLEQSPDTARFFVGLRQSALNGLGPGGN